MEANLLSISIVGVPLLAAPTALIIGLRKTLIGVLGIAAMILVAPFVLFGVWALWIGEDLWATLRGVSLTLPALAVLLGWMLAWSAAYGAIAAGIRLGWLYLKGVRT